MISKEKIKNFCILLIVLACIGLVTFVIAFEVRTKQIDTYVKNIKYVNSDSTSSPKDSTDNVKALKVVVNKKTYNVVEFMKLKKIPTVVDVIVMYKDSNKMVKKPAYVSYNGDKSVKDFVYQDDKYGRLILPSSLSKKAEDGVGINKPNVETRKNSSKEK